MTDPLAYNAALRVLGEFSVVALDATTLVLHRLVQAVVRARLDPFQRTRGHYRQALPLR